MRAKESLVARRRVSTAPVVAAAALAAAFALPAYGADWPAYRDGPHNLNYTPEAFTPPFSLVWRFTTEAAKKRVPPVVVGNRVFLAAGHMMYALDGVTGARVWQYAAGAEILSPPAYAQGKVFFGADNGKVIALNADSGAEAWAVSTSRYVRAAPVVVEGVVYAAALDRRVMAIDAATGALRWTVRVTDEVWGTPAVRGGMVYVPTADGQVLVLDAGDGRTRTQVTLPRRRALLHAVVASDDGMYIAGRADLRALGLRGALRWEQSYDAFVAGAPAFADGRLYVALINGRVQALDAQKGTVLWSFDFKAPMSSPPTVAGGVVVVGAVGGTVYALDAVTGKPRWRYLARPPGLAAGVEASFDLVAPAVYSDGSLYLMWNDGSLARFDDAWPDPAPPTIRLLTPEPDRVTDTDLPKLIGAQVFDQESGLDASSLEMLFDDTKVEADYDPYSGYFTHTIGKDSPLSRALTPGWHTVKVSARDQRGNSASKLWRFVATPGGEAEGAGPAEQPEQPGAPAEPPAVQPPALPPYQPPTWAPPTGPGQPSGEEQQGRSEDESPVEEEITE